MSMARFSIALALLGMVLSGGPYASTTRAQAASGSPVRRVLLISIDGLHAVDLLNYIIAAPTSTFAQLSSTGLTYVNATTSLPSDSFPGTVTMVTGGTPRTTGVWYDDTYDRALSPAGSDCTTVGADVLFDETVDRNAGVRDGGGGIDTARLPRDPQRGCAPVFPHNYLRVNTIFEVVKAARGRTAWADKHLSYEILNGPSGKGIDDLYTPEIAANDPTTSVAATEAYDDDKIVALLHEIDGEDHTGATKAPVPTLFGMNFQAVSVGQKLAGAGYQDAAGTPSAPLQDALQHTDQSIGRLVAELRARGLLSSTLIVISAKHGQAPIDPRRKQIVDKAIIPALVNSVQSGLLAHATQDDVALLWLRDPAKTAAVVQVLRASAAAKIDRVLAGPELAAFFQTQAGDSRPPDIVVQPIPGVIYTSPTATKIAEHGGLTADDTAVPILLSMPGIGPNLVTMPVRTVQIAPTILAALGLDPQALQAVQMEHTINLPGAVQAIQTMP